MMDENGRHRRRRALAGYILPILLLLGVGVLGAIRGGQPGSDIAWAASFDMALEQSRQTGKPIMVSFHTPGCGWCRKLNSETFPDAQVLEQSRRYVCVRVDSDVDTAVVERFGVMEYPLTLILNPQGKEIARFAGYVPPDRFAKALEAVVADASK